MGRCLGITKKIARCPNPAGARWYCAAHRAQPRQFLAAAAVAVLASYLATYVPTLGDGPSRAREGDFASAEADVSGDLLAAVRELAREVERLRREGDDDHEELLRKFRELERAVARGSTSGRPADPSRPAGATRPLTREEEERVEDALELIREFENESASRLVELFRSGEVKTVQSAPDAPWLSFTDGDTIAVRADLPAAALAATLLHELHHIELSRRDGSGPSGD